MLQSHIVWNFQLFEESERERTGEGGE
ncbi:hypothetical protein GWI33_012415, partial [Rhynchophorus ferrugineus]